MNKICYLDFDRTVIKGHIHKDVLKLNSGVKDFVRKIKTLNYMVILNTYIADLGILEEAFNFIKENGIEIDDIVSNKIKPEPFDLNANVIFIDDESLNIPLIESDIEWNVKLVDFLVINKKLFEIYGI